MLKTRKFNWLSLIFNKTSRKNAFTMAEILLSLTIIGVVAAITLPSLTGNINERTWNTQRKALLSRMTQAISLMPSLNGYGVSSFSSNNDTLGETFIANGLSKVLKLNNVCNYSNISDCGLPSKLIGQDGSTHSFPTDTYQIDCDILFKYSDSYHYPKVAAFETANGESVALFYKPDCVGKDKLESARSNFGSLKAKVMCANLIYDLNGKKGPNTLGKDVGIMSILYPTDSVVVAPLPLAKATSAVPQTSAGRACRTMNEESRVPNLEEAISMSVNKGLFSLPNEGHVHTWTSTVYAPDPSKAWYIADLNIESKSTAKAVRCIKRY